MSQLRLLKALLQQSCPGDTNEGSARFLARELLRQLVGFLMLASEGTIRSEAKFLLPTMPMCWLIFGRSELSRWSS